MKRLEEIKNEYLKSLGYRNYDHLVADIKSGKSPIEKLILLEDDISEKYAEECVKASLEKAKKDLYNYWIFFEEGKTNSPEFTIKVEDPAKVYNTAYESYGPQVEDLFYSCISHEESITNPENIILL